MNGLQKGFATGIGDTDNAKLWFNPSNNQIYINEVPEKCQGTHSYTFRFAVMDSDGSIDQHSDVIKVGDAYGATMESTGIEIPVKGKGSPLSNVARFRTVVSDLTELAHLSYSLESASSDFSKFLLITNTNNAS